jgi:hypothetical protein
LTLSFKTYRLRLKITWGSYVIPVAFSRLFTRIPILPILKRTLYLLTCAFITLPTGIRAEELRAMESKDLTVLFDPSLRVVPSETFRLYPLIKADLERLFGWELPTKPSIVFPGRENRHLIFSGSSLIAAFAIPARNLIVIDSSRVSHEFFDLEATLRHEMCHLLLHSYTGHPVLPRWLDEGVCQWVSGGIGEIIMDEKRSRVNRAAFSGRFISLQRLEKGFPPDGEDLLLAYEESKGFVVYLISRYGKKTLLNLLAEMRRGTTAKGAFLKATSVPLERIEREWHEFLEGRVTWLARLGYYLYEIVFALMAFVTLYAFIRVTRKKRGYGEEDADEERL